MSVTDRLLNSVTEAEDSVNEALVEHLTKRGWVPRILSYTGYGSDGWVRVMCRVVMSRPEDRRRSDATLGRGWRNFAAVPVADAQVTIQAGNATCTATTNRGGHVDVRVDCDLPPGWQEVTLTAEAADPARASVRIIGTQPHTALLSDIDDTVLVTSLPRPMLAAWNTFVLNEHARRPVPGMAVLYERLNNKYPDMPVFYLSTGAWNVAPTLRRFLGRNLYPAGPLLLTDWGPTEDRWFRSGADHKRRTLKRLAEELPQLQWILIGDDGQHDPELYSEFAAHTSATVKCIAIRHLSPTEQVLSSGSLTDRSTHRLPADRAPWVGGPNGAELANGMENIGVL